MGQLYYNRLTNNRIKNIALVATVILVLCLFILFAGSVGEATVSIYEGLVFLLGVIVATILLGQISFAQVIETIDERSMATYYKLGGAKVKYRVMERPERVDIE